MTTLPQTQADTAAPNPEPRLRVVGLSKTFGPNHALRDANLTIAPGEIHGLVGQNGSGKSTMVKLLSGYHGPDSGGQVYVDGHRLSLPVRPRELRRCGMSVVHQDLGLVDHFSVVENVRIGAFGPRRFTRSIRWGAERELARQAVRVLGHEINPDARVGDLLPADRATVAIARALQDHHPGQGLIMFDESSRALPKDSLAHFHDLIREVASRGGSVLLVSHQIEEVLSVTDRVTVLRDGAVVADGLPTPQLTERDLIKLILGYELDTALGEPRAPAARPSAPMATVSNVHGQLVRDVSFDVAPGEIVGLTGLLGSGFEELPYLIGGARRARAGRLSVAGREIDLAAGSPRAFVDAGVALVPERRDVLGLSMPMTLLENVTLPRVRSRGSRGRIGTGWQREEADWVVRELGVRPPNPMMPVGHLSGGNQQKVLLGKWLRGEPKLLVLHEPTRAVDVGARRDLMKVIFRAASAGCGVVVAGMDATELEVMCDRVLIVRDGRIVEQIRDDLTLDRILHAVYGAPGQTNGHTAIHGAPAP